MPLRILFAGRAGRPAIYTRRESSMSQRPVADESARDVWLVALNPTAKVASVLVLGLASIVFPSPVLGALIVVALFLLAAAMGYFKPFAKLMIGFGIPVTLMLLLIQGCYSPQNVTVIADLGFAELGLEGTLYALSTVVTLLTFLGGFYLMNRTTYTGELVADLTERGLPPKAGYLVLASLNVVPQMKRRMVTIQEAQVARGLDMGGGIISRVRATVPLLGPVVMSSLADAEERSMTLETHGFHLTERAHTSYVVVRHAPADKPLVVACVVVLVLSVAARIASAVGLLAL